MRGALVVSALLVLGVAGCGGRDSPDRPAEPRLSPTAARLVDAGYTVRPVVVAALRPRPTDVFLVSDVDWAVPGKQTFSVAVYDFASERRAGAFAAGLERLEQHSRFRPAFRRAHRTAVKGTRVYAAFTTMDPTICAAFGLCAAFNAAPGESGMAFGGYGITTCTGAPPKLTCVSPGPLPVADVERLVAAAERG